MPDPARNAVWTSLPIAALTVGGDGTILSANPAAEAMLNCSAKSLSGRPLSERLSFAPSLEPNLERARSGLAPVSVRDVAICMNGKSPIVASVQVAPLANTSRDLLLCLQSREIEDHLGRGRKLNSTAKSAIGMADILSHEIKNPLAGITGAAQLLAMNLKRKDRELTDIIVGEARRILALLEQFDQFGGSGAIDARPLNIHDLLDKVRKVASVGFAAGAIIEKEFDPSLPLVLADGDRLTRVFLNLLQNAADAVPEQDGFICIRTFYNAYLRATQADGKGKPLPVHVEIIDNGPGLPPGISRDIFEPFVSGKANGKGLGLALVSTILADLGGWIAVRSAPGRTIFRVSLPVASDGEGAA